VSPLGLFFISHLRHSTQWVPLCFGASIYFLRHVRSVVGLRSIPLGYSFPFIVTAHLPQGTSGTYLARAVSHVAFGVRSANGDNRMTLIYFATVFKLLKLLDMDTPVKRGTKCRRDAELGSQ